MIVQPLFGRIVQPPGVVDDVVNDTDRDRATEVQTNFIPSQKFAMIPPLFIILNAKKQIKLWHTPSNNVGVVGINRREYQRNHIKMYLGL